MKGIRLAQSSFMRKYSTETIRKLLNDDYKNARLYMQWLGLLREVQRLNGDANANRAYRNTDASQLKEDMTGRIQRAFFFCATKSQIERMIEGVLVQPRTALLTSQQSIQYYWRFFEKYMKTVPHGARFAHNEKLEDSSDPECTVFRGIWVTAKLESFRNKILENVHALAYSGIYDFWERHDGNISYRMETEDSVNEAKPLSLASSDVGLIFQVHYVGLAFCVGVFLAEILAPAAIHSWNHIRVALAITGGWMLLSNCLQKLVLSLAFYYHWFSRRKYLDNLERKA
jgi:hypothetical protein